MTDKTTYIGLVQAMVNDPPQSAEAVKAQLGIVVTPVSKDRKLRDEGAGETPADLVLEKVSLSYMPTGAPNVLVLTIPNDVAPPVDQLIDAFPRLKLTEVPRGKSLNEETVLSRPEAWGTLSFGMAESDRDKLRSVMFKFQKPD
ncbi:hypothetical protein Z946_865 [Sulfitobacter noctilucicola]|uniref:Uncharacterized protein n=1 Tax=Sulfitobacter noctilucicola TaxID=1342301 RepID=A0A7W6M6T8_9RHOB|nr:hypothetical protein [Sulfitobacter noctilucicola]KIN62009.1 hypothetical protein Z946_865 [Sulfitobacter noctilucicola]MBB4173471.1 hypothetical protein [Sulfitobacter noctilucicola]